MTQPMAPRPGQAGADYARSRVGSYMPDSGLCLQCTRQNFDIPSYYISAIDAWHAADNRHPGDRNPPVGVSVWFDSSSIYGHVATAVGGGDIVTTFNAEIRLFGSISQMEGTFGPYMGWANDVNEMLTQPTGSTPTPIPPVPMGDLTMKVIYDPESHSYALTGAGYKYIIPNQEQADVAQKVWGPAVNVGSRYAWDLACAMGVVGED